MRQNRTQGISMPRRARLRASRPALQPSTFNLQPRLGLAPLELVLSLPILMFVMALMIIMGTSGAWKVRVQANARQAAWRALTPRTGANDDNPLGWPSNAEMQWIEGNPPLMPFDPFADHPVVRGPVLSAPSGGSLPVRTSLVDATYGIRHGHTRIQRPFPLFAVMPPHRIDFAREHVIVDATLWQYWSMGIGSNTTRRVMFLYNMMLDAQAPQLTSAYVDAAIKVVQNPRQPELTPLEGGDPEVMSLIGAYSPNFVRQNQIDVQYGHHYQVHNAYQAYPLKPLSVRHQLGSVPRYCSLDTGTVQQDKVRDHVRIVERFTLRQMTQYYISVYQTAKSSLEAQVQQLQQQNPPAAGAAAQIAALQAQIAELDRKIEQLSQFMGSLPPPM